MHGPLNVEILRHYCSVVAYNTIPFKPEFKATFFFCGSSHLGEYGVALQVRSYSMSNVRDTSVLVNIQ
jgi:hypothetical protein